MSNTDDTQAADSGSSAVDSLTRDEVDSLVRKALEDYETRRREDDAENVSTLSSSIEQVGVGVDDCVTGVSALSGKLDDLAEVVESEGNTVVVLDSGQWQDIQRCWGWTKNAAGVALFLVLVTTLLVSALLGSRIWDTFTKGWRH